MSKSVVLFIFIFFAGLIEAGYEDVKFESEKDVIKAFDELKAMLNKNFEAPVQCSSIEDLDFKEGWVWKRRADSRRRVNSKECDIEKMCEPFKANYNNGILYQSPEGGHIPNWIYEKIEKAYNSCKKKSLKEGMTKGLSEEEQERMEEFNDALEDYQDEVKDNKIDLLAINAARSILDELTSEKKDKSKEAPLLSVDREVLKKRLNSYLLDKLGFIQVTTDYIESFVDLLHAMSKLTKATYDRLGEIESASLERIGNNPNQNLSHTIEKGNKAGYRKTYQKKLEESHKYYEEVRDEMISQLKNRRNEQNAQKIDAMIERIKTIKMKPINLDPGGLGFCPKANAFYHPYVHSFYLCPQILEYPPSTIKSVIAHELSHAIDPCFLNVPLASFASEKKHMNNLPGVPTMYPASNKRNQFGINVRFAGAEDEDLLVLPDDKKNDWYFLDVDGDKGGAIYGEVPESAVKNVNPGIGSDSHPMKDAIDCLQSSRSVDARIASKRAIRKKYKMCMEQMEKELPMFYQTRTAYINCKKDYENLDKTWERDKHCGRSPGSPQTSEAFSDYFGTEVMAALINREPAETRKRMVYESMGFFMPQLCDISSNKSIEKMKDWMEDHDCEMDTEFEDHHNESAWWQFWKDDPLDAHPDTKKRVEKLIMANPMYEKYLGCKAKGIYCGN